MDDDWKLKQLEEDVRHEKALRELHASHLDAHDRSFAAIQDTLNTVAHRLDEITVVQNQTAVSQAKTEAMLQDLIATIAREHGNGKH